MQHTIEIENGPTLILRSLTEEEAIKLQDKKTASMMLAKEKKYDANLLDDGDEEILQCVISPSREELNELIEDKPFLTFKLHEVLLEISGFNQPIEKVEEVEQNEEMVKKYTKRIIGFKINDTIIGCKKISRLAAKLMYKEVAASGWMSSKTLVKAMKEHLLPEYREEANKLFSEYGCASMQLAGALFNLAFVQVNDFAGKA